MVVIYLFVQFAKPVVVKQEEEDSGEDEDERRDMNIDMLYYVKSLPKMQRLKDVDLDVGKYTSAKQYLFEDEGLDSSYRIPIRDFDDD